MHDRTSRGALTTTDVDASARDGAPSRVDRYVVHGELGRGGFGTVYAVTDERSGEHVALKVVRLDDPAAAERLLREARVASMLDHPSIVRVRDAGTASTPDGAMAFVAMERLRGLDLRTLLLTTGGKLSLDPSLEIALQVLDALATAHARDVVHRDVKPANVFVVDAPEAIARPTFEVKLLDFGISRFSAGTSGLASRTAPGSALGTPGYMAPEQLGAAHTAGPRADVYAVGATLFEMLAGQLPFPAESAADWQARALFERAPPLQSVAPGVPAAIARVVDRALARDPDARWPTAAAFRDALGAASAGEEWSHVAAETTSHADLPSRSSAEALAPTMPAGVIVDAIAHDGASSRGGTAPLAPPAHVPAQHRVHPTPLTSATPPARPRDPLLRAALVAACVACAIAVLSAALVVAVSRGRDGRSHAPPAASR
ncbi:MAG: protein kinase [Polyangiaceae bacterium]